MVILAIFTKCVICDEEVEIKVEERGGHNVLLNGIKFEVAQNKKEILAWHDYCCSGVMLTLYLQQFVKEPRARQLAVEALKNIRRGVQKIKLVPEEFLYVS